MSSTDPSTSTEPDTSTSSSTTDSQVLPEETSENIYVDDSVQKLTLGDGTEIEITVDGEHLSCVGQDIQEIPIEFGESYGDTIKYLDLSYNQIKQLTNLDKFTKLDTLCVDNNELISEQVFPELSSLASLSLNNNNIEVLDTLISEVSDKCPNLRMLSLLKNPACPNYFFQKDDDDYNRYRYLVLHQLENLKFLDSSPVSKEELAEAKRVGQFSKVARPVKVTQQQPYFTFLPLPFLPPPSFTSFPFPHTLPSSSLPNLIHNQAKESPCLVVAATKMKKCLICHKI
eukprot:TRINITY_DN1141_c0_g1_i4.p1 TRINITY_DN1141_c0_g1~~TRINITY_DN1141_c0_g1_i4.p1  ORF type:complete len:286 (+),score=69.49 TRINITY_DN1141_c0_g1_i4:428-1285(+)